MWVYTVAMKCEALQCENERLRVENRRFRRAFENSWVTLLTSLLTFLNYMVSELKGRHHTVGHIFSWYWPIFKFFPLALCPGNLQWSFKCFATLPWEMLMLKNWWDLYTRVVFAELTCDLTYGRQQLTSQKLIIITDFIDFESRIDLYHEWCSPVSCCKFECTYFTR